MFIDRVRVQCVAGKGGNGIVAWRREKYIPKGGPAGGNGGKGGSVIVRGDHNIYSLDWFSYKKSVRAPHGANGGSACRQGKCGEDLIIKLPLGTLVRDAGTNELLFDIKEDGEEYVLCQGGKGGKGNHVFRSSTNRSPNIATPGHDGQEREIEFELKLIADVGLVGFPNAGKSTLIHKLADVRVKIAPYPFTTLQPNLGYIDYDTGEKILIADIPGIIKGASQNRGLGYEFLRHIERTKVLVFVLDLASYNEGGPLSDFHILKEELSAYDTKLLEKPWVIVLNKSDVENTEEMVIACKEQLSHHPLFVTSALEGKGCAALKQHLYKLLCRTS